MTILQEERERGMLIKKRRGWGGESRNSVHKKGRARGERKKEKRGKKGEGEKEKQKKKVKKKERREEGKGKGRNTDFSIDRLRTGRKKELREGAEK